MGPFTSVPQDMIFFHRKRKLNEVIFHFHSHSVLFSFVINGCNLIILFPNVFFGHAFAVSLSIGLVAVAWLHSGC